MNGNVIHTEEGSYGRSEIALGDLVITVLNVQGKNGAKAKVKLLTSSFNVLRRELTCYEYPRFPSIQIDPTRDMDALVKDIKKRLITPALPILEVVKQRVAEKRATKKLQKILLKN